VIEIELAEEYIAIRGNMTKLKRDLAAAQKKVSLSVASMQKILDKWGAFISGQGNGTDMPDTIAAELLKEVCQNSPR